jgi:hypothetical protein
MGCQQVGLAISEIVGVEKVAPAEANFIEPGKLPTSEPVEL